ncbi:MAG TPA: FtsK/SpoIIIE domain-containing protein [Tepidisphaeraceae bacterium]|nr:FtsK/SpoIIIE domain-containing protein [Tepidisphaeraceae bacterium]
MQQISPAIKDPPTPAPDGAAPDPTRRDLQRDALRSLVALTKECAAQEAQIEQRLSTALAQSKKLMDRAVEASSEKYKKLEQNLEDYAQNSLDGIDKKHQSDRQTLESSAKAKQNRANHEHQSVGADVKQKLDQAVWLADSVLEAAEIRIREEHKKAKERVANGNKDVDDLEQGTAQQMIAFAQSAPEVPEEKLPATEDPVGAFEQYKTAAQSQLTALGALKIPQLMTGGKFWLLAIVVSVVVGGGVPQLLSPDKTTPNWMPDGVGAGALFVVGILLGVFLTMVSRKQVQAAYVPLRKSLDLARAALKAMDEAADKKRDSDSEAAINTRKSEIQSAKERLSPVVQQAQRKRDGAIQTIKTDFVRQAKALQEKREAARVHVDKWQKSLRPRLQERADRQLQFILDRNEQMVRQAQEKHDADRAALEKRWSDGLVSIRAPIGEAAQFIRDWTAVDWERWTPPKLFAETVRFGEFQVDLKKVVEQAAGGKFTLPLPDAFALPALMAFPRGASLAIHADRAGRADAIRLLQLVMIRLLTSLPPGRARFTIIDPVGLGQNFAGFMHLADFDEALVGARIWTDREQIEKQLADLTEHMETVIQKYLRNEFETIDEYNAQAGELAEPYRFLVIADFPTHFEQDAFRRLTSIATTGARCGVYVLIARDTRAPIPAGSHFEDVEAHCVNLIRNGEKFAWRDEIFRQFPLTLDAPPPEETLTQVLQVVGKNAKEAKRVEVSFDAIAPKPDNWWSQESSGDLHVPVGRMGATRLQQIRFGRGVAQHGLIAGKTGSGKSTLLNAIITNMAMWYPPSEVEMYLIDFKKGVEFKTYGTHSLPHARAIAVESDREFGISVLQRLDGELTRRGELYRKAGTQDLAAYRRTAGAVTMPRILLIIDEFQEFFSEDDKLAQEAGLLLDRLVRQGRAFGIHVLLGSQTLAGAGGLSRSTVGQMGIRIALQCNEADSQLILGDNNSAARLLSRPGEAIYNDAGGLVEGNSPFQVAWLGDERREQYLIRVNEMARQRVGRWDPPIVFEGNAAAPITKNLALLRLLEAPQWPPPTIAPLGWLGEPVAIKEPTAVPFRRQSGANMLMIGQQDEAAMGIMSGLLISLAAQYKPDGATFYLIDGSATDSPLAPVLPSVKAALPHDVRMIDFRAVPEAINEAAEECKIRMDNEQHGGREIFIFVYGIQRFRVLRKTEEEFGFGSSEEGEKKPKTDKQFVDLLREGPPAGIHVIAWADTPVTIERTFDRAAMREFDSRLLFQMSANDSSNLIDSPAANKLGVHRAIIYSEEQGTLEKFRPYGPPDKAYLEHVKDCFDKRQAASSVQAQ